MGSGHTHSLYREGTSAVHRLPAAAKLVAHLTFVLVVVATPAPWFWAFAAYLALLASVAIAARVPAGVVVRRMVVEVPFVVFAVVLPFVATGARVEVLGLKLSESGLLSGWNILAKGTIGVIASILLAATTDARSLLDGLRVLRLPAQLVDIAGFMVRYAGVVHAEMHRMRIARESRGFQGRRLAQLMIVARGAGALFVRTYERGERVHLAMLARGGGSLAVAAGRPQGSGRPQVSANGGVAAVLPGAALAVLLAGWAFS
jgi:cobalt/nickel transport system permease protein